MSKKRFTITIKGRVQGVGYRYFCLSAARELKLKGYVKNQIDGSVYADAQGDEKALKEFLKKLKKGPSFSKVNEVLVSEEPNLKDYESFSVRF